MNKIVMLLILSLSLVGCQKDITTFKEVIVDDQVEMDGITYDIKSIRETTFEYDNKGNMIKRYSKYDDQEQHTEFTYKKNLLVEERRFSFDRLSSTIYYTYEDDRKVKTEIKYPNDFSHITLFTYDGINRKIEFIDTEGNLTHYNEGYVDEMGNLLTWIGYDAEGNLTGESENFYENNRLIRTISKTNEGNIITHYYEYNTMGDKIFWYMVHQREDAYLNVNFYEYEYNKKDKPIKIIQYSVYTPVELENTRDYWDMR
jgi:hypothetical protein